MLPTPTSTDITGPLTPLLIQVSQATALKCSSFWVLLSRVFVLDDKMATLVTVRMIKPFLLPYSGHEHIFTKISSLAKTHTMYQLCTNWPVERGWNLYLVCMQPCSESSNIHKQIGGGWEESWGMSINQLQKRLIAKVLPPPSREK